MRRITRGRMRVACVAAALACSDERANPTSPANPADPDGGIQPAREQIAYYGSFGGVGGLALSNLDGSGTVNLGTGWSPAWSPDGKRLVFSNTLCDTDWETYLRCDRGGLVIMNPETREAITPASGAFGEDPDWSPNGDMIAFTRYSESEGRRQLFVMRLDGSPPQEIATPYREVFWPSWSSDSRRIVFGCYNGSPMGICVSNADGLGFALITNGHSPAWSPDGSTIAFVSGTPGNPEIFLMVPNGTGLTRLTEGLNPDWSPDGTRIVFSRNNDGLFAINRDGSNLTRLTRGNHNGPAWRPK